MKTQIIKIIPCLLAGFILSACVGAVNLPSSETEKTDKTEAQKMVEPEPIKCAKPTQPPPVVKRL